MSTLEKILEEIRALTPAEQAQVRDLIESLLPPKKESPSREEYEKYLLAQGVIRRIPPRTGNRPDDLKNFKPIKIKGKPLSETIIEERR